MSNISSVASRAPVTPTPPVSRDTDKEQAKAADKAADLAATAVKAQATKKAGTGTLLDIQA